MKLLDHPNIMKLYDVWETTTNLYLILEYIQGGELFDYLCNKGPRPIAEVLHYFQQLICAVDYCHRFNIAHRDLKLENILIDHDSNIKVADFGMATWQDRASQKLLNTSCGSPHYAAPEVVSGKPYNGPPADIWSCGVILYALIVARLPFDDDDCTAVLHKISQGKYHLPHDIDPKARDLISRMLTIDLNKRITMPEILRHPFFTSQQLKNSHVYPALDIEHIAQPIKSRSAIDPDIFANLRTLWHGVSDSEIVEALLNSDRNWQKGIYHLLINYRHKYLAARQEEEQHARNRRRERKLGQSPSSRQADLPERAAPPTPRRARRLSPGGSSNIRSTSSGLLPILPPLVVEHPADSRPQTPALPVLTVPELDDPKIQEFFVQVANHLNVLQARTNSNDHTTVSGTSRSGSQDVNFERNSLLHPGQNYPTSSGSGPKRVSIHSADSLTNVKPLTIRRRQPLPTVTIGGDNDKENRLEITEADIARRHSPLVQHQFQIGGENNSSLDRQRTPKNQDKNRLTSSPAPSDGSSSLYLPSPTDSFTSSPKRSWIDNVFKFKTATYTLYSRQDVHSTRNECRRLLMQMDMLVVLEESEKLGVLKCRYNDLKDASLSNGAKTLRFRVELQWPTPQLCHDGYLVTLHLIQEKGSLEAFKGIYQHLKRIWTLGSDGTASSLLPSSAFGRMANR